MIVREFEDTEVDRRTFHDFCFDFYHSNATIRDYDKALTDLTFDRIIERHENLCGFFMLEKDTSEPVGYALVTSYWCNEEGGNVIVLDELYTSPNHRKRGYASMFMEWLEAYFRDTAVCITLEVLTSNVDACHLYYKEGYVPDGFTTYTKKILKKSI
jgi:GNAT superfamily N-acetyltransferase